MLTELVWDMAEQQWLHNLEFVEQYDGEEVKGRMTKMIIRRSDVLYVRELDNEESEKIVSYWKSRPEFKEF
ncbi:hypothetical protein TNCV_3093251 [Trichonephila clavipes]|nr:hypothetical protein TNCV_3093251 [Trichonephila clavipes]